MQRKTVILLPLLLLAACSGADLQSLMSDSFSPWGAVYNAARDERSVADIGFDKAISTQIKGALLNQDGERGLKVKVYCYLRMVTLLGQLEDDNFKAFALATAWATEGVRGVTTHWEAPSAGTGMADLEIAARLRAALVADEDLSATQIETEVFSGKVYLIGMVRSPQDADRAVAHAQAVKGVTGVTSLLILPRPN